MGFCFRLELYFLCHCFCQRNSPLAKKSFDLELLVMEEQREGRRERFCLDMEAQEADGQVDLGVKQMDIWTCM